MDARTKWDRKYAAGSHTSADPSPFLLRVASLLPTRGRALDVAGGAGRNAVWLGARGLDVTIADISSVGLALAKERCGAVTCWCGDLEASFPMGPWDLVVNVLYLQRSLFAQYKRQLRPGAFWRSRSQP